MAAFGPSEKYNSGAVPHGGIFVRIFRPGADPTQPSVGAISLGSYRCESIQPKIGSELTKRPDIDGGPNGWFITDKDAEGSAVIQRNVNATTSLLNGDYFDATVYVDASAAPNGGVGVAKRFVIHDPDLGIDAGYRKMSCSVIIDQNASGLAPCNPLTGQ